MHTMIKVHALIQSRKRAVVIQYRVYIKGKRGKETGREGKGTVPNSAAIRNWCFTQKRNFNPETPGFS